MALLACLLAFSARLEEPRSTVGWGGPDFVQYYVAWELIAEGKNPYDSKLAGPRQLGYGRDQVIETYAPPWSLLPALPVAGLPLPQAILGFIIINLLLLAFCTLCWSSLLSTLRWGAFPYILFGVCFWLGTLTLLGYGQISLWPLVGFTGWLWCSKHQRQFPAGLFLVLTIIKPHTGLLPGIFAGVYALRQRHRSTIAAFVLGLLGLTAATLWFRPTIWSEYLTAIRTGTPTSHYTATLDGWLRVHFSESFRYLTWPLWLCSLFGAALVAWKIPGPPPRLPKGGRGEISLTLENDPLVAWSIIACLATVVFVPYGYSHDYIFMLPGYFLALGGWLANQREGRIAFFIWLVLYAGLMYLYFTNWTHDHYWIVPWLGLATTIWLLGRSLSFAKAPPLALPS
jgi:hypothetical protein